MMRSNDGSRRAATPEPHASACAIFQRRASRDFRRPAFTLIEMVVAVSVMSVLMFGVASAILIASHAMPKANDPNQLIRDGAWAVDELSEEVRAALWFIEHTATAMTLTVPDRDNDGLPERIRYEWSGSPGDPLTRQYNGGTVVHVIEELYDFALSFEIKSVVEQYPGPEVESAEVLHNSYTGANNLQTFQIREGEWIGEYFKPTLPVEATSWSVTRVRLIAKLSGAANGETRIQLRTADGSNLPTGTVLEEKSMWESFLPAAYEVQEFAYSTVSGLFPDDGLCLVLEWVSGGQSADILYDDGGGSDRLTTTDAGSNWNIGDDKSMRYTVYGKYFAPGPQQTATRQYVTQVGVKLQPSSDPASKIVTAAPTYNMPEVLSAYWELDFDRDPRTADVNADGTGDWINYSGAFDPGMLTNGIWYASNDTAGVRTVPDEDFATLTTVELRCRATSVGGAGAEFWINADRHDGKSANLIARLRKPTAGSQELRIGHELAANTYEWLRTYDVPDDFVVVRLVIDPAEGTFAVFIDGVHRDTFTYWWGNTDPGRKAWLYRWNCSAEFDYLSIRVSE